MKRKAMTTKRLAVAVCGLAIMTAGTAHSAEYFVTTNGLDSAGGESWATAWRSVTNAVVQAEGGSTIHVSNGVYTCAADILIDKALTIQSVNGPAVTTVERDGTGGNHRIFTVTDAGVVLDGFTIRNGSAAGQSSDIYSGAGVHMTAGATIRNCIFRENKAIWNALKGGAIHMTAGLVEDCEFYDNAAHSQGGAINMSGSSTVHRCIMSGNTSGNTGGGAVFLSGTDTLLENCLIANNNAGGTSVVSADGRFSRYRYSNRGGGVYNNNGTIRNCTIAGNVSGSKAYRNPGQGVYMTGAAARAVNCIIYYNGFSRYAADRNDVTLAGGSIDFSCAGESLPGEGNTVLDPDFADWENGDFTLLPGSPGLDGGTNIVGMTTDILGNPRRVDGTGDGMAQQDMGAFETVAATGGVFRANAAADINEAFDSLNVNLSAHVAGSDTNNLSYSWDLTGDGEIDATTAQLNHVFDPGLHTLTLTVSNAAEGVTVVKPEYIRVAPSVIYVVTNGANVFPYATPENAALGTAADFNSAISAALATPEAATRIEVAPGDYPLEGHIVLDKAVTMTGMAGASETVLRRMASGSSNPRHRVLNVFFEDAVAEGFTIRNGSINYHEASGAGVMVLSGGLLRNCIVRDNEAVHGSSQGGGGILIFNGGTVRNCLVTQNRNYRWGGGTAALDNLSNALFQNCTIVSNTVLNSTWLGGGSFRGVYENGIITDNVNTGGEEQYKDRYSGTYTYTLSPGLSAGEGNIDGRALFVDADSGDYQLLETSPGIHQGIYREWMEETLDLAGNPRISGPSVDMGAYEYPLPRGTMILIR